MLSFVSFEFAPVAMCVCIGVSPYIVSFLYIRLALLSKTQCKIRTALRGSENLHSIALEFIEIIFIFCFHVQHVAQEGY